MDIFNDDAANEREHTKKIEISCHYHDNSYEIQFHTDCVFALDRHLPLLTNLETTFQRSNQNYFGEISIW